VRISTLLIEPVPTACPTLSGTKYSKRSDFVGRVTIRVARGVPMELSREEFALLMALRRNDAVMRDVPIKSLREEFASLMVLRRNDAASRVVQIKPRREEFVGGMEQR
jgi:hypothetical protein